MWILCFVNLWISYQQNSGYENNNHKFLKVNGSKFTPILNLFIKDDAPMQLLESGRTPQIP